MDGCQTSVTIQAFTRIYVAIVSNLDTLKTVSWKIVNIKSLSIITEIYAASIAIISITIGLDNNCNGGNRHYFHVQGSHLITVSQQFILNLQIDNENKLADKMQGSLTVV